MHESGKPVCQSIVVPQFTVDEHNIIELQSAQLTLIFASVGLSFGLRSSPLNFNLSIGQSTEPYAPPFKDDNFDRLLTGCVHQLPLAFRTSITGSIELALIVTRYLDVGLPVADGIEELSASFDIMGGWYSSMLDQGVLRVSLCQALLLIMRKIQVIDRKDYSRQAMWWTRECSTQSFNLFVGKIVSPEAGTGGRRSLSFV